MDYIDRININDTIYDILPHRELGAKSVSLSTLNSIPVDKRFINVELTSAPGSEVEIGLEKGLKPGEELFAVVTPSVSGSMKANGKQVHNISGDSISFYSKTPFVMKFTCIANNPGSESYLAEHYIVKPLVSGDITIKEANKGDYLLDDGSCVKYETLKSNNDLLRELESHIIGVCVTQWNPPQPAPKTKHFIAMVKFDGSPYSKLDYTKFTKYISNASDGAITNVTPPPNETPDSSEAKKLINGKEWTDWLIAAAGVKPWEIKEIIPNLPKVHNKSWYLPAPGELNLLFPTNDPGTVVNTTQIAKVRDSFGLLGVPFFNFLIQPGGPLLNPKLVNTYGAMTLHIYSPVSPKYGGAMPPQHDEIYIQNITMMHYDDVGTSGMFLLGKIGPNEKMENVSNKEYGPIMVPFISFTEGEY